MNFSKFKPIILLVSVFVICYSITFCVLAWYDAPASPPTCPSGDPGCDAPINAGPTAQVKTGALQTNGFQTNGELTAIGTSYLANVNVYGNMGVGVVASSYRLEVSGTMKSTNSLVTGVMNMLDTNHSIRAVSGQGVFIDTYGVVDPFFVQQSTGNVGIGDTSPAAKLTVGNGDLFQVNSAGDIIKIKNISYVWPSAQGAVSTCLQNNGAGTLSWAACGGGGTPGGANTQVQYNNSGVFGGASQITYDNVNNRTNFAAPPPVAGTYTVGMSRTAGYPTIKSTDPNFYLIMDSNGQAAALNWYSADNVILANGGGKVGIGTIDPGAKLEVAGTVKIVDGTQGAGKVLTSDATGLASWQTNPGAAQGASATISTVPGWYRIASNSGNRASAEFSLRDSISGGGHSTLTFRVGVSYN
ncbi:MAG: hypothetical protein PHE77_03910, partial [Candidatus Pacebacteria bacterium]|nr:hypothetical protein [Candidatus Paceibacterota bacterium]